MSAGECLVTGGAGFIGCALSKELAARYSRVVVLDSLHPQIHKSRARPPELAESASLVIGDVADPQVWDQLLSESKPETVIHLAAETGTGQSLSEGSRHAYANVLGTTQMLDAFVRHSFTPKQIIFSGSRAVYGEGAWRRISDGSTFYPGQRGNAQLAEAQWDFPGAIATPHDARITEPHPTSIYGATKLAQENILRAWALSFGTKVRILRFQNVYGPGQSLINPYTGIVSLFVRLAKNGDSIPLYEDGEVRRDFVFIKDVVSAVIASMDSDLPPDAGPWDIGCGAPTTIRELATIIAERYRAPAPHISGRYRNGDVRHAWASILQASDHLGWMPDWDLRTGVTSLCEWIDAKIS